MYTPFPRLYVASRTQGKYRMRHSYAEVVERQERLVDPLSYAWGVLSHLTGVKNSDPLREVYQELQVIKAGLTGSVKAGGSRTLFIFENCRVRDVPGGTLGVFGIPDSEGCAGYRLPKCRVLLGSESMICRKYSAFQGNESSDCRTCPVFQNTQGRLPKRLGTQRYPGYRLPRLLGMAGIRGYQLSKVPTFSGHAGYCLPKYWVFQVAQGVDCRNYSIFWGIWGVRQAVEDSRYSRVPWIPKVLTAKNTQYSRILRVPTVESTTCFRVCMVSPAEIFSISRYDGYQLPKLLDIPGIRAVRQP